MAVSCMGSFARRPHREYDLVVVVRQQVECRLVKDQDSRIRSRMADWMRVAYQVPEYVAAVVTLSTDSTRSRKDVGSRISRYAYVK